MKLWSTLKARIQCRRRGVNSGPGNCFDLPSVTITDRIENLSAQGDQLRHHSDPSSLSFLYALTKRWAWGAVAFRCETHPQEAQSMEQDSNGDTILHWACFGSPPVFAIEAILLACPELASIRNLKGFLPLHTACCYRANSRIIRALVQAYPDSAGMTIATNAEQSRSTPLHLLCDYGCHPDSMRAILETNAGVITCRKKDGIYRRTPLQILNERKNLNEFHHQLEELRRLQFRRPDALMLSEDGEYQDDSMETALLLERIRTTSFWEKTQLLVFAEYTQQPVETLEPTTTTIVHALIGLRSCPIPILEFANMLFKKDLLRKDKQGQLPLHIASQRSDDNIICDLLRAQPKAASITDASGALALQIYLERDHLQRWNRVIESLIIAFPLVIEHLNLDRRLYPLIWCRLAARDRNTTEGLDALFLSVRNNPTCFG